MADARAAMMRLSALVGERALFENDPYRKFWVARLLAHTPSNAIIYTMLILVVEATGKNFSSSLFVAAYIAPSAVLGTISGALVDRLPKGIVLAATNAARAGLCVLLAVSTGNVLLIYVIAVGFAVAAQFSGPAEAASLPSVVEQRDLTAANSLNNLGSLIAQVAGLMVMPAVFLKTVGPETLAVVSAAMLGGSAFAFLIIEGLGGPISEVDVSIDEARERFAQAWRRLTQDSVSYVSVVIAVLANTSGLVVITLLPRYMTQVLDVTLENAIFVAAPAAAGIWLALRFVRRVTGRVSAWWSIGGSFAALVAGICLLAFIKPMAAALEGWNPFGAFDPGPFGEGTARIILTMLFAPVLALTYTFVNVVTRAIVNERMPREMQGRIFSAQIVLTNLASIPPILLTGVLADLIGVTPVFFFVGAGCGALAVFYAARNIASPSRRAA